MSEIMEAGNNEMLFLKCGKILIRILRTVKISFKNQGEMQTF